ncbi:hypothetical protein S40288_11607 [Stachybotrys chartarum IBT 40288]|nr:hypothetical protein S40288_11607 [Stachybotrys chartarum IBT 40288]
MTAEPGSTVGDDDSFLESCKHLLGESSDDVAEIPVRVPDNSHVESPIEDPAKDSMEYKLDDALDEQQLPAIPDQPLTWIPDLMRDRLEALPKAPFHGFVDPTGVGQAGPEAGFQLHVGKALGQVLVHKEVVLEMGVDEGHLEPVKRRLFRDCDLPQNVAEEIIAPPA